MLVRLADICLLACVSICILIKNPLYLHLKSFDKCVKSCNDNCFTVLDTASTYNQPNIKEALHILWEKPILIKQVKNFDISLSFK